MLSRRARLDGAHAASVRRRVSTATRRRSRAARRRAAALRRRAVQDDPGGRGAGRSRRAADE